MHEDTTQPDRTSPLAVPHGDAQPPMPAWRQAALSLYWFATQAQWSAVLLILLPQQAALIGGAGHEGTTLGNITLVGALASMVVAPFVGAWSDRAWTRWGRRRPFIVVGTLANALGLVVLAFIPAIPSALWPFILAFGWIALVSNLASAPYSAMIPDVVAPQQRGSASGWMGLMTMLGNFVGGGLLGFLLMQVGGMRGAYLILAAIMVIGMLGTVLLVDEPKRAESVAPPPFDLGAFLRGLLEPFAAWDFRWVFLTRFLVMLGIFTVQGFVLLYLRDMVGQRDLKFVFDFFGLASVTDVGQATSFFLTALLIGALVSSLYAGAISDRYGRKPIVYLSGALQGIVALTFLFAAHFPVVVLLGLVFGLGYGAYQAVDWALVTDVLPSADDHAKDMGLWHIALTLPQVIALPIAGILLDTFNRVGTPGAPNLGYYVIFSLAFVYFMLGTVLVSKIKGAK